MMRVGVRISDRLEVCMKRLTDHLIVISFDCLASTDFPILQDLPHFRDFIDNGSYCRNVKSIYPSLTYPCHTTIVTGNYPNRHGVINNTFLQPGATSPDWYWHRKHIQSTTLYDEAKKAGLTTAALLWPVTAQANIDYNMPEIFANRPWHHQIPVSLRNGSPLFQIICNAKFGRLRNGLQQPALDDFVLESTVYTIKKKKPNLLLVHFVDLDSMRHYHGFSSRQAHDALSRHNQRLGRIVDALKEAGIYEHSTIVLLGDHSQLDHSRAINLNVLLKKQKFIEVNEKGRVINWKAYCKSCDGSAYIYIKDERDLETKKAVFDLCSNLAKDENYGIEQVYTGKEAEALGADNHCFLMLEAKRGFYFTEYLTGELLETITKKDVEEKRFTLASHGYSPEKPQYGTVFIAKGNGIRDRVEVPEMELIDEGPTLARILGLRFDGVDGRVINEMLNLN